MTYPLSSFAQDRYSIPADPNLKYSTPIAPGMAVPDKIESSIGTLNLSYGYPSADTVEKIYDNLDRSRALQAYLMAIPVVNQAGMRDSLGTHPAEAIVLFDGTEATFKENWTDTQGNPSAWRVVDGALESVKKAGYIQTKQNFGSCQIHLEWAASVKVEGDGQGLGNSGVFLMNTYEVQVLDSFENPTYADGQAGAVYGRQKPLVNVCRKPGEWQTYDIIFHRPLFDEAGKVTRRATFTVLHNGVLVQDHTVLSGGTGWMGPHAASEYKAHPDKLPFAMQDHGNPVCFRNIWIRELKD